MSIRILTLLILMAAASALTVQVNNIHYGSRNTYQAGSFSLAAAELTLNQHIIAKDELTPDVVAFIKSTPNAVTVDFSRLRREFQLEDIDLQAPRLLFRFIQKPFVVVSIYSEASLSSEAEFISMLLEIGQPPEEEQL